MKALRSLLIYAVIGFAGYAYFSYEDWLDQASATMGGYESGRKLPRSAKYGGCVA
jgi:hypothetical protein